MRTDWQIIFRMMEGFMENSIRRSRQPEESAVQNQIFRIFRCGWSLAAWSVKYSFRKMDTGSWMPIIHRSNFAYWHIVPEMSIWSGHIKNKVTFTVLQPHRYFIYRLTRWLRSREGMLSRKFTVLCYGISSFGLSQDLSITTKRGCKIYWWLFCNLSGNQDISGSCSDTCKRRRVCGNTVRKKTSGSGAFFQLILCNVRLESGWQWILRFRERQQIS